MAERQPDAAEREAAHVAALAETVAVAERVLGEAVGGRVRLAQQESFRSAGSRPVVLRCAVVAAGAVESAGVVGGGTVFVKRILGDGGTPYDATGAGPGTPKGRMVAEWSGLRFLHSVEGARRFGPAPLAGDPEAGVVVLEDLGTGDALSDVIQREGPGAAQEAEALLFAYATTLGRMHAATAGRRAEHRGVRAESGGGGIAMWDTPTELRTELLPRFRRALARLELASADESAPPDPWETEVEQVAALLADPGPFDAFSVSDTCPDNHRYVPPRDGETTGHLRFFDFEFSNFRHCLVDAAYTWMPFPTCWCVNRLPDGLALRLEGAYRSALASGCPAALDDARFGRGMAAACVYWMVTTMAWSLSVALDKTGTWGISTTRQRHPLRADTTAAVCERFGQFPAVVDLARRLAARLRERWGEEAEMPLYPAFR